MRLILIGTDRNIFVENAAVRERIARFSTTHTTTLDSIVFSARKHGVRASQQFGPHANAHPTNSISRLLYGWDALRIAKTLTRPDIVSAQDPFETGLVAFFIARYFRVPFIVEVHTDFVTPAFARHSLINRLRVLIAGFVLRHAAGGYAVSERVRDEMVRRYDLNVPFAVLPIYVDLSRFQSLPRTPRTGNLLWVGRFTTEKNPTLAIKALAAARAAGNNAQLTLLGSGPLEASLRALTKRLKLDKHVIFAGWADPAAYLPETELLLATSDYEGYGMAIVEALAAGVPVLSTDVGVAREAGAILAEGDFAAALIAWMNGPRAAGVLALRSYANEEEYFTAVANLSASYIGHYTL